MAAAFPAEIWKERESASDWVQKDLLAVAAYLMEPQRAEAAAAEFRDARILVTGATGLIGSLFIKSLAAYRRISGIPFEIHALIRDEGRAEAALGQYVLPQVILHRADLRDREAVLGLGHFSHIVHAGAVTSSKTMVERPVDTIETALFGTESLLRLAAEGFEGRPVSFLYISSMEVYGDMSGLPDTRATEEKLGYLDLSKVRTDYPESKRMAENLCAAYRSQYGVETRIARLAQCFGPGILPWEGRVFSQFAKSVLRGEDIVLHTRGLSEGNYVYTTDCVRGLFDILLLGAPGETYNVANMESHTTIGEMARMVADKFGKGHTKVVLDIPEGNVFGYAGDTKLMVDSSKLMALGWRPEVSLRKSYEHLICFLLEGMRWSRGDVTVRMIRRSDTDDIIRWREQPHVKNKFVYRRPFTWESHLAWLDSQVDTGKACQMIIEYQGRSVGSLYIRDIDHQTKTAEGGIFIGEPDALGKGIATCCVKILESFSRERLGLEYIRVRIFKDNAASVRVHEKLGYSWESDLPGVVCTDGTVGDMIFMGHAITDGVDSLSYDFETIT